MRQQIHFTLKEKKQNVKQKAIKFFVNILTFTFGLILFFMSDHVFQNRTLFKLAGSTKQHIGQPTARQPTRRVKVGRNDKTPNFLKKKMVFERNLH
jgi:hypothetical protein